jgi:Uma2 family endonuclease
MAVGKILRLFTVDDYHQMGKTGILRPDDRVELIEGEVVEVTPIGRRHAACVARATDAFAVPLRGRSIIWVQNPIRLDDYSEPQPDVALLRPKPDFYASAHPTPADVLLIVEVADSSIEYDRRVKLPLYARAGIPEVWLALPEQDCLEVRCEPSADGYRVARTVRRGERLAPIAFPDLSLGVEDLLG